ncbi:YbjN domain-containing protein [Lichenihabitans sp. Uapishka_5]|uniref:YbjN domain-containing protein n=1 Tax=Lichenihabitans sp. Uapishka_5 TaxID=3037302 RepID=UPI0029E82165|nr:YbjN domain-containing protein [Lichenihabitans sp. Uapishka_5]MDX7950710.1 YbjN domain-containing protein [Lichenihabitans sp. Uapishka_5]
MSLHHFESERTEHPVDVVERIAAMHDWNFDRDDRDEISISVAGKLSDLHVAFTWLPDLEALHVGCAFDLKVPDRRRAEILLLISAINEHLWIGHFDLWSGEDVVMFRHSLLMAGGADPDGRQCEAILKMAVTACDRYYQAFQFVIWAGKPAREALDSVMFETEGEA